MQYANSEFPKVDIIIPTYNQAHIVKDTINSVLNQDYPAINIIISDDASVDGTQDILREYKKNNPETTFIVLNKKNLGITKNANSALKFSKSDYVIIFAGDDLMRKDRVSKQMEVLLKNPTISGCMSDVIVLDMKKNKQHYYSNKDFASKNPKRIIAGLNQIPSASLIINKKIFGEVHYDERTPFVSDWLLVNQVAIKGMEYITEPLTIYRRHINNTTKKGVSRIYLEDRLIAIDILYAQYPQYFFACKTARSNVLIVAAFRHFLSGNKSTALKFIFSSIIESPFNMALMTHALKQLKLYFKKICLKESCEN